MISAQIIFALFFLSKNIKFVTFFQNRRKYVTRVQ